MKYPFQFILVIILNSTTAFCQYSNAIESHLPASPTAASFSQYAEVPVNQYTGAASSTIPLFSVTDNQLSHNISLRYHGSGIKASEIATSVGLGWNLSAGGAITRSVRGAPDERLYDNQLSGYYSEGVDPSWFSDLIELKRIQSGERDISSDLYFYNFGEYSGSFYFNDGQEVVQRDVTDLVIEPVNTGYAYNKLLWKVTTPDGTKYFFGDDFVNDVSDDAVSYSNHYVQPRNQVGAPGFTNPLVDSWFLVKIESYDGTSTIEFEYDEYEAYSFRNVGTSINTFIDESGMNIVTSGGGSFADKNPILATECLSPRITAVVTNNRRIEFEYDNLARRDLDTHFTPGLHPKEVVPVPSSKVFDASLLDEIREYGKDGTYLGRYDLGQTYFTSPPDGFSGTLGLPQGSDAFGDFYSDQRRLRLNSLNRWSSSNVEFEYGFEYNESEIQRRLTYAQDHHGYPNGKTDNITLLPKLITNETANTPPEIDLSNVSALADRSPDASIVKEAMLKKINFPSGGSREFDYEGHEHYTNDVLETGATIVDLRNSNCSNPFPPSNCTTCCVGEIIESNIVTLSNATNNRYTLMVTGIKTPNDFSTIPIDLLVSIDPGNGNWVLFDNIVLDPANEFNVVKSYSRDQFPTIGGNNYRFRIEADPSRRLFMQLLLVEYSRTDIMINKPVGGLRVKSVIDDPIDGITVSRTFTYEDSSTPGASSGFLVGLPTYIERLPSAAADNPAVYFSGTNSSNFVCQDIGFSFNSGNSFALASVQGNHIGYERVVETRGVNNGYTEIIYNVDDNHEADVTRDFPALDEYFIDHVAGHIKEVNHYNDSGVLRQSQEYEYQVADFSSSAINYELGSYPVCGIPINMEAQVVYSISTYPSPTQHVYLDEQTLTLDGVTTISTYEYDGLGSTSHTQRTSETVTNSDGKEHRTEYTYGVDYTENASIKNKLVSENRILPAWQTIKKVNNIIVDGRRTLYAYMDPVSGQMSSTTSTGNGIIHPRKQDRREVTWQNGTGTIIDNGWDELLDLKEYDIDVGRVTKLKAEGYADDHEMSYSSTGALTSHDFNDFTSSYTYDAVTDRVNTVTNIDGTSMSYVFDDLVRLHSITDDCRSVVTTMDYHYANQPLASGVGGSADKSFVKHTTDYPTTPGSGLDLIEHYEYVDGLQRKLQLTRKEQAPNGTDDVVIHTEYDDQGRPTSSLEPFASILNGSLAPISASLPRTEISYDDDPLQRSDQNTPPSWYQTEIIYGANTANDAVLGYPAGTLNRTEITDPNGNKSIQFTDKLGRLVLERKSDALDLATNRLDTYHIYDDKNREIVTLPPGTSLSDTELIFRKVYDGADNVIARKMPDCNEEHFLYDERNLLVASQNPVLQASNQWVVDDLDAYGRSTRRGFFTGTPDPNNIMVSTAIEETFYDGFDGASTAMGNQYTGKVRKSRTKLLDDLTTTNTWIETTYEYDECGRSISMTGTNHFGAAETASFTYDAADNILTHSNSQSGPDGSYVQVHRYTYDHIGRKIDEYLQINGGSDHLIGKSSYTIKDELEQLQLGVNGTSSLAKMDYQYNDQGWLTQINTPLPGSQDDMPCTGTSSFTFPVPSDLFYLKINYDQAITGLNTDIYKNGNISSLEWQTPMKQVKGYGYSYDFNDRLTKADYGQIDGSIYLKTEFYSSEYGYDKRGNLMDLKRNGRSEEKIGNCFSEEVIDDLTYTYTAGSNQLTQVSDASPCPSQLTLPKTINRNMNYAAQRIIVDQTEIDCRSSVNIYAPNQVSILEQLKLAGICTNGGITHVYDYCPPSGNTEGFAQVSLTDQYEYDDAGNLTTDPNKDVTISYNYLNLPYKIVTNSGVPKELHFQYDAIGNKLYQEEYIDGVLLSRRDYSNGVEYHNSVFESIQHSFGRSIKNANGSFTYEYHLKDHLGNTRIRFADLNENGMIEPLGTPVDDRELLSEAAYYPFGMTHKYSTNTYFEIPNVTQDRYSYNGKEKIDELNLDWMAYGARQFDPVIGRFTSVDPLADAAAGWTPYRYGFNNPILYTDPDGLFEDKATAKQYAKDNNIKTGWFRSNKIIEQSDGTWAIENKKSHTSTSDLGGDLGVIKSAMVAADDIMSSDLVFKDDGFLARHSLWGTKDVLRDGSVNFNKILAGTAPDLGPGKVINGLRRVPKGRAYYDILKGKVVKGGQFMRKKMNGYWELLKKGQKRGNPSSNHTSTPSKIDRDMEELLKNWGRAAKDYMDGGSAGG